MERGRILLRRLDTLAGKPLIALAGLARAAVRFFAPPRSDARESKRIGVLCIGAIGDLLLVTALLSGLRRELPGATIEVIASRANAACLPLLPEGIASVSFRVTDIRGMLAHIRAARYDICIDAGQWTRLSALVSAASGAGRVVGFATPGQHRHYAFDHTVPHRRDRHEKDNFLALGRALFPDLEGAPVIRVPETPSAACPVLPESNVVFCHMWPAGLHSHLKEWPAEHWAKLAVSLAEAGYTAAFTGGPEDAPATAAFLERHIPASYCEKALVRSVAGTMSLPDLAWHLGRSAAVVSVNTGVMHLAAIAGAPIIALNGPTNPLRWGPVGSKTCALLPEKGRSAYLNLGFEYEDASEAVLRHLSVTTVLDALAVFGLEISRA